MRHNDETLDLILSNYRESNPDHSLLGGCVTESELIPDLATLFSSIQIDLSPDLIPIRNDLLLMFNHNYFETADYSVKVYNWKYDQILQGLRYKELPLKIQKANVSHLNILNLGEEELMLKLTELPDDINKLDFDEINNQLERNNSLLDELNKLDKVSSVSQTQGHRSFILQMLLLQKFLNLISDYIDHDLVNSPKKINVDHFNQINRTLSTLSYFLDSLDIEEEINTEVSRNQLISGVNKLLEVQLGITDRINNMFI